MFELLKTDSREEERSLIGAALMSNRVVDDCSMFLQPADFQETALGQIWSKMMAARADGKPTKFSQLVADGSDGSTLEACQNMVASALGFESYAKRISEAAQRRRVVSACMQIISHCQESPDSEEFKGEVFDCLIDSFGSSHADADTFTIQESALKALETAIAAFENGGDVSGQGIGLRSVDEKTSGLHPGELVILAARPGMGKTTFALNIARSVSSVAQVAFFSLEMPYAQLGGKLLSAEIGLDSQDLRRGRIGRRVSDLKQAVDNFKSLGLTVFDKGNVTLGYMRSKLHQLEARTGKKTALVIVDYLQLMSGGGKQENRVQEVSKISRGLKLLARDFQCPVIALSQLNRSVESRTDKRPMMSDLRESGSIEQDADLVWFLYRDDYYNRDAPKGVSELILSKQRNGPICTIPLMFEGRLSQFTEYTGPGEFDQWH